ncbi:hypothetical protein O6H91_07G128300 [Diphasiastrum complanatum]|nr:hypothetical protein O6H91_07G128300 [Diphasiastrum complanatum]
MSESTGDRKDRNMLKNEGDVNKFQNQRWKKSTFADYMDRNILFESSKNQKQLKARQKNLCRMEYPMTTINQQQSSFSFSWPTDDLRLMNKTSSANCSARSPFTAFSGSHQPANNPDDVNSVSYFRDCADDNIDRQDDTESQVTTAVGSFDTFDKTVELFHRYNSES